jgi:hypothetical protein
MEHARRYVPGMVGAEQKAKTAALNSGTIRCVIELLSFKDKAFQQEAEWRLWDVASTDQIPKFRTTPTLGVVPYVEIDLGSGESSLVREI